MEGTWEEAQKIKFSVDVIACAKHELSVLGAVHATPSLRHDDIIEYAIKRYLRCWLPLASKFHAESLIPPLDCAWIWHCHRLNPVQYGKDCQLMFGKLVDARHVLLDDASTEVAQRHTSNLWQTDYPDQPYIFLQFGEGYENSLNKLIPENFSPPSPISHKFLESRVQSQTTFYYQVCRPWMSDHRFLQMALERYKGFLYLIKTELLKSKLNNSKRPFVVPTYDIDLLWHAHQLCPGAYALDTSSLYGEVLHHDDNSADRSTGGKLQTGFVDSCHLWYKSFGRVYERAGVMYRGKEPDDAPTATTAQGSPSRFQFESGPRLTERKTLEMQLVVFGARNIRDMKNAHFFVRVTAMYKCPTLKLTTALQECSQGTTEVVWNAAFAIKSEISTQGLRVELMACRKAYFNTSCLDCLTPNFRRRNRPRSTVSIGEVSITWDSLLDSSALGCDQWFPIVRKGNRNNELETGIQVRLAISVTPPTLAPFLFRMSTTPMSDLQLYSSFPESDKRLWLTKTVVDHEGRERFAVRMRDAQDLKLLKGEIEINVHITEEVTLQQDSIIGAAKRLKDTGDEKADGRHMWRWSLLNGSACLTLLRPSDDIFQVDLKGNLGDPVALALGRRLEYETKFGNVSSVEEYVSLIRYTKDAPRGKATALINWLSGHIEVMPEESVTLVILIASVIQASMHETRLPLADDGENPVKLVSSGNAGSAVLLRHQFSELWDSAIRENLPWDLDSRQLLLFNLNWWELSAAQLSVCGYGE